MPKRIVTVDVDQLELNLRNPRYPDQQGQLSALEILAKEQGIKLLNLAEDIAMFRGLDPSQNILVEVSPTPDVFIVLEGNRRTAALKLIHDPALSESLELPTRIKNRFRALHDTHADSIPREVDCTVLTKEEAEHWIFLRHTGANSGVGVEEWDGIATQRFRGRSPALQALDMIVSSDLLDEKTRDNWHKIPISTLKRIFDNADARIPLGVEMKGDEFEFIDDPYIVRRRLAIIISDLINKRIKTADVYRKDQIVSYVERVAEQVESGNGSPQGRTFGVEVESIEGLLPSEPQVPEKPEGVAPTSPLPGSALASLPVEPNTDPKEVRVPLPGVLGGTPVSSPTQPPAKRPRPLSPNRKGLMPDNFALQIHEQRLNKIYHELRELNIDRFSNSVSVIFRVFVELSLDVYAANNNISLLRPMSGPSTALHRAGEMTLAEKVRTVNKVLLDSGKITRQEYNLVETWSLDVNKKNTLDFLHEYVHNPNASPSPSDLKAHWDHIQDFVQQLHT